MADRVIEIVLRPYPRCYVYIHHHPQRETDVVYVGKGTRGRAWDDTNRSPEHRCWLRDIQNLGFAPDTFVRIERRKLTSDEAEREERALIAFYRRQGKLLFNKSRNKKRPVRRYQNKWMPDPKFGRLGPPWPPA